MTILSGPATALVPTAPVAHKAEPTDTVTFSIDGIETEVPKGTLVIRAAEELGIQIPRFCDHPLLAPAGACRQCLVEVWAPGRDGKLAKMPKPQASCTLEASPGMQVKTQHTSAEADKAQHGVMELLLINHPLDCPVCDKGGECPLQNQAMSNGRASTRFVDIKRTFPKPIAISTQVLLDRERCILCQRCTRFSEEIAGDVFIDLQKRGANQQIGRFDTAILGFEGETPLGAAAEDTSGRPFASYFSGNTVQICPVGALTSAAYRFRSRPFDLVSTPGVGEHDAQGSAIRVDHRRGVVLRRLAGEDPTVNQEWITDKDRFAFTWQAAPDRITTPLVRNADGELEPASWVEALDVAAAGLRAAAFPDDPRATASGWAVLPGGRLTLEDAYAYGKFARVALGTNDVDGRARPHSAEEEAFLGHHVAGRTLEVTFADLDRAPAVLLVGLELEEEAGIAFLRLRSAVLDHKTRVLSVAALESRGLQRLSGTLVPAAPGTEAEVLDGLPDDVTELLGADGAVILVGERLAGVTGGYSAALRLAQRTGARLAWVPRRVGERSAVEAGLLPSLLPGGRPVADSAARVDLAAAWGVEHLPAEQGRSASEILSAARSGLLGGLVVGGLEPADLPDPAIAREALDAIGFLVSLEVRRSEVTDRADVVFPVAPPTEKSGTFVTWEGRPRPFPQALESHALADHRVLDRLADALGVDLGLQTLAAVQAELDELGGWDGARVDAPSVAAAEPPAIGPGTAVLATWHQLLDTGRLQSGEPYLAGTAKRAVARISLGTATGVGVVDGGSLAVGTDAGTITLPVVVTDMPDHVVWLPTNSLGSAVRDTLHADAGDVVRLAPGTANLEEARPVITLPAIAVPPVTANFSNDTWWIVLIKAVAIVVFLLVSVLFAIWFERKVVGRMQQRPGPNVHGPFGLLQSLADAMKLLVKEDMTVKAADKLVYVIAPMIAVFCSLLVFAVIPFGPAVDLFGHVTPLQLTDFPVAVLYILACASVGVYGIVLGGWSSGSTYPLLGSVRSTAQVISYELAMGLSLVSVFIVAGSMSTSQIVTSQVNLWWFIPLIPAFVIYIVSMVGETNRLPFDLPEAEGELVSGYMTEYSSMKFAWFFLAEYINMLNVSAIATTLFLGGWRAPWPISAINDGMFNQGWWPLLWFIAKIWIFMFFFVWVRGSVLRFRYDQFMKIGWKILIPFALGWVVFVGVWQGLRQFTDVPLQRILVIAAIVVLVAAGISFLIPEKKKPDPPKQVGPKTYDPYAGGYPVPPLPGQVLPPSPRKQRMAAAATASVTAGPSGADDTDGRDDSQEVHGG